MADLRSFWISSTLTPSNLAASLGWGVRMAFFRLYFLVALLRRFRASASIIFGNGKFMKNSKSSIPHFSWPRPGPMARMVLFLIAVSRSDFEL